MLNTNRKAKRKLQGASPPKRKAKGSKNSEADCLICEEAILKPSDTYVGDEAVFCEGSCQGWCEKVKAKKYLSFQMSYKISTLLLFR